MYEVICDKFYFNCFVLLLMFLDKKVQSALIIESVIVGAMTIECTAIILQVEDVHKVLPCIQNSKVVPTVRVKQFIC